MRGPVPFFLDRMSARGCNAHVDFAGRPGTSMYRA
jgi:hypothetical protein